MLWVLIRIASANTHNICYFGEITKIIPKLSINTLLICSTDITLLILSIHTDRSKWQPRRRSEQGLYCLSFCLCYMLTHICLVDLSILINWTSPFPNLGESGVLFFIFILFGTEILLANSEDPDQTPQTWVCTVCLCPIKGTLDLYGSSDRYWQNNLKI